MSRIASANSTPTSLRSSRRQTASRASERLVIVGAGMAAHRLCERIVELGLNERYEITMLGAEATAPYDRIRLGEALVPSGSVSTLHLRDSSWYVEHGISLVLAADVTGVDRQERAVFDARGRRYDYDLLVLATGSEPRVPGCVSEVSGRVHVYRDYGDAEAIKSHIDAAELAPNALVLGGGLLGIELASALRDAGCSVTIYEAASHLLSRQLDVAGSRRLLNALAFDAIQVELNVHVESLRTEESAAVATRLDGAETHFDFAVVAVGVVPRDRLARAAGLRCYPVGGVSVDPQMQTSDPQIFAVGECANVDGTPFGLVAPCYEMVESLVQRLAGKKKAFRRVPVVTKLKYDRLPTAVVGDALVDEPGFESYLAETDQSYRRLVVRRGKLVGATSIGGWDEWPSVLAAAVGKRRFGVAQRARFTGGKDLWSDDSRDARNWAAEVPLCSCTGATCGSVREAIQDGCDTLGALSARTGAGTVCGSCTPLLEQLLDPTRKPLAPRAQRALAGVGLMAFAITLLLFFIEPVGWAKTFQNDWRADELWRNKTLRQVTGFTLAGVCALSLLLSARKRIRAFNIGKYGAWRLVHSLLGIAMLVGVGVHTGFRFGANLNFWLMLTFVLVTALGGLSAIAAALEHRLPGHIGGAVRRRTLLIHQILFWPFPVLVFIHALKSLYF